MVVSENFSLFRSFSRPLERASRYWCRHDTVASMVDILAEEDAKGSVQGDFAVGVDGEVVLKLIQDHLFFRLKPLSHMWPLSPPRKLSS